MKPKNTDQLEEGKILSSIKNENNFSVPSDYFDVLPEKIMDRIQSKSDLKQQLLFLKPSFAIPSLAICSGLIILLTILFNKSESVSEETLLSENEVQHVVDYPELYNINDAVITEQYISSNIPDETMNYESAVSEDEIKIYFEENPDATNILNEY